MQIDPGEEAVVGRRGSGGGGGGGGIYDSDVFTGRHRDLFALAGWLARLECFFFFFPRAVDLQTAKCWSFCLGREEEMDKSPSPSP